MKLYKKLLIVFSICFLFQSLLYAKKAPDFELKDTFGNTVKLSDYKNKVVFLDFWASWCPPCRKSVPAIIEMHRKYNNNPNIVILAINSGEKLATIEGFIEKQKITYKVLISDIETSDNYNISSIPSFFIIDKEGNIVKQYKGYYPGLEKEWEIQINRLLK